jgi:hypothetical protein
MQLSTIERERAVLFCCLVGDSSLARGCGVGV